MVDDVIGFRVVSNGMVDGTQVFAPDGTDVTNKICGIKIEMIAGESFAIVELKVLASVDVSVLSNKLKIKANK